MFRLAGFFIFEMIFDADFRFEFCESQNAFYSQL